ncbi:hypothetical protein MKW98_022193 [Papaver atlanticum]|uniref:Uncharacterized protein n=1 Tax=Papaver atlanticum TaxID=357466 RepID=A0AAD4T5Y9_9MAGN|nr:hypothetical protein MKW98_022193 [Papaver atlanticum]
MIAWLVEQLLLLLASNKIQDMLGYCVVKISFTCFSFFNFKHKFNLEELEVQLGGAASVDNKFGFVLLFFYFWEVVLVVLASKLGAGGAPTTLLGDFGKIM